jgi:integrase
LRSPLFVDEDDVINVLQPIEAEGKKKTRGDIAIHIKTIIEFAEAQRWRPHGRPNPARREFLKHHFAKRQQKDIKRVKPMKVAEAPAFASALRAKEGTKFRALEFLMLTNVDPNNVLSAKWGEIEDGIWTTRKTKGRGELFEVPLSSRAKALLEALPREAGNEFVFPGRDAGRGLGESSLGGAMRELCSDVTPRGLRPTFKTWAQKDGRFKYDVIETAMRHKVGGDIERLYDHNQWVAERRALMDAWAHYLDRPTGGAAVVPLRRA